MSSVSSMVERLIVPTVVESVIIRSTRVVLPEGIRPASIHIADGRIVRVLGHDETGSAREIMDYGDFAISPGVVDTHVHINEPGRTEWEGFDTATRAAAAGGVTTLVDMPLNSVPATTSVAGLDAKRAAAGRGLHVDVAFWGGVVPGNTGEIEALIDAGVCGFKCFLVPSGVDEFPAVDEHDLREALPSLARRNVPLLVQAASGAVDELALAQAAGVPITAETCPHYLTFAAEEIADGSTEFKCAPPIREASHRDALWDGLRRGVLGLVATDHSPAPPELKTPGDFMRAWGGIASLELSLAAVWTTAVARGFGLGDIARWMSAAPAALAGVSDRKGSIAPGRDADLVVWDPAAEFVVDPCSLQQRHKLTPYAGRRLRGMVRQTWLRGRLVWDGERATSTPGAPSGRLL